MLDVRGRVLQQTLALTHVGSQLRNLSFGSKAGSQQSIRMEPLQAPQLPHVNSTVGLGVSGTSGTTSMSGAGTTWRVFCRVRTKKKFIRSWSFAAPAARTIRPTSTSLRPQVSGCGCRRALRTALQ